MMQFFLDLFSLSWVLSVRPSTNSTPFDVFFFCEFTKCPITSAAEYMKLHSISSNFSFVVRVLFEGLCIGSQRLDRLYSRCCPPTRDICRSTSAAIRG
ncbi:hypothetical protein RB195_012484 [Necator americanus]|uniref:Secreted protein n=1 Tax=Necator americanus TaxID=51031 RepID=A0ABR1D7B4_NECAM